MQYCRGGRGGVQNLVILCDSVACMCVQEGSCTVVKRVQRPRTQEEAYE